MHVLYRSTTYGNCLNKKKLLTIQTALKMDYDIVSEKLELADPTPDIWELFRIFDQQFFEDTLKNNCVELSWSPRMTQTAGLCAWNPKTKFCSIRLSLPLLQLRSRKDLVETLLHEMIHGFLFVTHQDDNHESHGDKFHFHMFRINQMTGTSITVYHTFHNEVRNYQNHVWKCDGPCVNRRPFFGLVKRAMNRKPGPNDNWWKQHQDTCGGTFHKISEPDPKSKPKALAQPSTSTAQKRPISSSSSHTSNGVNEGPSQVKRKNQNTVIPEPCQTKLSDYWSSIGPGRRLCD